MPIAYAYVIDVQVTPENPIKGDTVKIVIRASPNEKMNVSISYEKEISVNNGKYEYRVDGVSIPAPPNYFTIKAINVKNLHVSVWMLIWITKSAEASNGVATVSQANVPAGTYNVIIHGDALEDTSTVRLQVTASKTITTDENGYYEYSYNTSCIPPGTFTIKAGTTTKTITLREAGSQSPQPAPSGGGAPPAQTPPKPATFEIKNLELSHEEARIGEPVQISIKVENVGGEKGTYTVKLFINGRLEEVREVEVEGGSSKLLTFTMVRTKLGTYTVQVDGITQTFTVKPSLYMPLILTQPQPVGATGEPIDKVKVGEPIALTTKISNKAIIEQETLYIIQVRNEIGRVVHLGFISGKIPAETTLPFAVEWLPKKPGTYTIEAYAWKNWKEPIPLSEPTSQTITITE
jgi:hypothetical protein